MLLQTKVQWRIPSDCQTPPDTRLSDLVFLFDIGFHRPSTYQIDSPFIYARYVALGSIDGRKKKKKRHCLFYLEGSASSCSWTWLNYIVADDLPRSDLSASRFQQHTPPSSTATLTMYTE